MTSVDSEAAVDGPVRPDDIKAVPLRHPGRWVAAVVLAVLAAQLVHFLVSASKLRWDVVRSYLFDHQILVGVQRTVWLTLGCMAIGVVLRITLAVMRMSPNPVVKSSSWPCSPAEGPSTRSDRKDRTIHVDHPPQVGYSAPRAGRSNRRAAMPRSRTA